MFIKILLKYILGYVRITVEGYYNDDIKITGKIESIDIERTEE